MSDETITAEQVQQMLTRGPYHQWLGLQVLKVERDAIEIKATWREEWVVNPDKRYTHGGILAALVDLAADWAWSAAPAGVCPRSTCESTTTGRRCRVTSSPRAAS